MNNYTLDALLKEVIKRLKYNAQAGSTWSVEPIAKDTLEEVIDLLIEADYP